MAEPGRTPKQAGAASDEAESDAIARSRLSSLLGFRLRQAETAMHKDFIRSLKPTDLTQKQYAVLLLVQENPGVSQIELCALLGADPNTMMAFLDRLSDRGLILRVRSRVDRRKMELHPTPDGLKVLDQALALVHDHEQRFQGRFASAELRALMNFLARLSTDDPR